MKGCHRFTGFAAIGHLHPLEFGPGTRMNSRPVLHGGFGDLEHPTSLYPDTPCMPYICARESKCPFFLFKHVRTKNPCIRFFFKCDKFSGIPPNIGFDWVLSI